MPCGGDLSPSAARCRVVPKSSQSRSGCPCICNCTGPYPCALDMDRTVAPPVQDGPCTGGEARVRYVVVRLRTVHCVADGPAIRHSKVQGPEQVIKVSPRFPICSALVPNLLCACLRRGTATVLSPHPLRVWPGPLYLPRYPDPSIHPTLAATCGHGQRKTPQVVAHYNNHPLIILSLLLLQHSRPLRVSACSLLQLLLLLLHQTDPTTKYRRRLDRLSRLTSRLTRLCVAAPSLGHRHTEKPHTTHHNIPNRTRSTPSLTRDCDWYWLGTTGSGNWTELEPHFHPLVFYLLH